MINKNQVIAFVNENLGINTKDWERSARKMFYWNPATKTCSYVSVSDEERLYGLIYADSDSVALKGDGMVEITRKMWMGSGTLRKSYDVVTTIVKSAEGLTMMIYLGWYFNEIKANAVLNKAQIKMARDLFSLADAPEDEVIRQMATSVSDFRLDPAQYAPGVLKASITHVVTNGRMKVGVELKNTVTDKTIIPNIIRWEVWPSKAPLGIADTITNRNASAQFPRTSEFWLTTDLRDRESWPIMSADKIRIRVQVETKEDDGDIVAVVEEKIIDLNGLLPVYNYFGL